MTSTQDVVYWYAISPTYELELEEAEALAEREKESGQADGMEKLDDIEPSVSQK